MASNKVEVQMKANAKLVWKCIGCSATLFPSALPKEYKKIDVIKGDGNSVDSIRVVHFADGDVVTSAMEEITEVDEENKKLTYEVIGGDALNYYLKATLEVISQGTGCLVKWIANSNRSTDPNFPGKFIRNTFKNLDAFLDGKK